MEGHGGVGLKISRVWVAVIGFYGCQWLVNGFWDHRGRIAYMGHVDIVRTGCRDAHQDDARRFDRRHRASGTAGFCTKLILEKRCDPKVPIE